MFAFYVTGASVRVWMGNEAPFCFSPLPPLAKVFLFKVFRSPLARLANGGSGKEKQDGVALTFPTFFKKRVEA